MRERQKASSPKGLRLGKTMPNVLKNKSRICVYFLPSVYAKRAVILFIFLSLTLTNTSLFSTTSVSNSIIHEFSSDLRDKKTTRNESKYVVVYATFTFYTASRHASNTRVLSTY